MLSNLIASRLTLVFTLFAVILSLFVSALPRPLLAGGPLPLSGGAAPCPDVHFREAPEFPSGINPSGITSADLDGDGKQDLAVAFYSGEGYGISVFRNTGDGFAPRQVITMPFAGELGSVSARDIDADGRIDLVVTYQRNASKISIFRNLTTQPGTISFQGQSDLAINNDNLGKVDFGDMDNDGSVDVVVMSGNFIGIFRNVSPGTGGIAFAPRLDFIIFSPGKTLSLGDFDGDGKTDVAAAGNDLRILRNLSTGPGSISLDASAAFNMTSAATGSVTGDFDADGKMDVAVSTATSHEARVVRNTSTGPGSISFAASQGFRVSEFPLNIAGSDFNGDGRVDIATVNKTNSVSILLNNSTGPGNVGFAARPWDFGAGLLSNDFAVADFNADGKPDVAVTNRGNSAVSILKNTSQGTVVDFETRKDYLNAKSAGVNTTAAADFDGDGFTDIAASFAPRVNVPKFSVYANDGHGHFPDRYDYSSLTVNDTTTALTAGDFDNDGKPDVVVMEGAALRAFRNVSSGPGNFSFQLIFSIFEDPPAFPDPQSVTLSDLNSDGKRDVVLTYGFIRPYKVAVLRNASTGPGNVHFLDRLIYQLPPAAERVIVEDVDQDSKPDLLYSAFSGDSPVIEVRRNTSPGPELVFFGPPQIISEENADLGSPLMEDLDGDSKKDLISLVSLDLSLLRNTSTPGNFSFEHKSSFTNQVLGRFSTGDVTGDGKPDLVAATQRDMSPVVTVLKNTSTGPGSFNVADAEGAFSIAAISRSLPIVADLNNDGKRDVITNYSGSAVGAISVLINDGCRPLQLHAPYDFDGDGKSDVSVFRPSDGNWYLLQSAAGYTGTHFGIAADQLAPADYDGDGKTDIAVFRDGAWYLQQSTAGFLAYNFGQAGDIPQPADFNGDGKAELAVFRPSDGGWYKLDLNGYVFTAVSFGQNGDKPVVGDYDGDGKADPAVYRGGSWYILGSTQGYYGVSFGIATDKPVPADYDGDGKTDQAVVRDGFWYLLRSTAGYTGFQWGTPTDLPVAADYDGDGKADVSVFRDGFWYLQQTSAGYTGVSFGSAADKPVPNSFVP